MDSKTKLPKIAINGEGFSDSSSEDYDWDTDSEYGEVNILKIDQNEREFRQEKLNSIRAKSAYIGEQIRKKRITRPWSSTLRQAEPRTGKRLLLRRQSTEEYLEEMSDEMFERVNRLSRSTAATMARDAQKQIQPYLSPREKKKPKEMQPLKINLTYSQRFTGCNRPNRVDINDVVSRLYKVDPDRKKVGKYVTQEKKSTKNGNKNGVLQENNERDRTSSHNSTGLWKRTGLLQKRLSHKVT